MDLIYTDKNKNDLGTLLDYSFDLAFGSDENDFELTVTEANNVCQEDYFIYIYGTEYGGVIDKIDVDTAEKIIKYKGRTFHGILNSKVICPDSGQDYYVVSGDVNTVISGLISRLSLGSLFRVTAGASGISVSNYKFKRYVLGYDGICDMLESVGAKLNIQFVNGYVELSAVAVHDYEDDELDSDHIGLKIEKIFNPVNHLVCLGQGELASRTVIHLYCDANGNISTTQTFTGIDEYANVYDYPNVESVEELQKEGTKHLRELNGSDKIEVDLDDTYSFDIGDIIHAEDIITGIQVTRRVLKKIVKIDGGHIVVNYKVGE